MERFWAFESLNCLILCSRLVKDYYFSKVRAVRFKFHKFDLVKGLDICQHWRSLSFLSKNLIPYLGWMGGNNQPIFIEIRKKNKKTKF